MSRLNEVVTIKGGRAAMEEAREILKEGARRAIEGEPLSKHTIADFTPDDRNANKGTERGTGGNL